MTAKYVRLRPAAMALPAAVVEVFQADAINVRNNVRLGLDALAPHRGALESQMPTVDWDAAFGALDIAEALVVADERGVQPQVSAEKITAVREELQTLRVPAMLIGRGLALMGYLPLAEVERIEAGKGLIDMGRDGIALATLYRDHGAAIVGMHPFTFERIARMETLGEWIVRNVVPSGARVASVVPAEGDAAVCDRLWTLLVREHAVLRKGAFMVFGEDYGARVPALRSYPTAGRGGSAVEEPAAGKPTEPTREPASEPVTKPTPTA